MATKGKTTTARVAVDISSRIKITVVRYEDETTWYHFRQSNKSQDVVSLSSEEMKTLFQMEDDLKKASTKVFQARQRQQQREQEEADTDIIDESDGDDVGNDDDDDEDTSLPLPKKGRKRKPAQQKRATSKPSAKKKPKAVDWCA
jgi:hypothetical protein